MAEIEFTTASALQRLANERSQDAWDAIIERHGAAILRMARRISNDESLCEDICQETLIQICCHAGRFRPPASTQDSEAAARGWIMRIACCTAFRLVRGRARIDKREAWVAGNETPTAPSATEVAVSHEQAEIVQREVGTLPESLRLPICLHFYGELPYAEVGAALACSEDAARKRVQRGVERLRLRLAHCGVLLGTGMLFSALAASPAQTAETASMGSMSAQALDPQRLARWRMLLQSARVPALAGIVSSGTVAGKFAWGIFVATLISIAGVQTARVNALQSSTRDAQIKATSGSQIISSLVNKLSEAHGELAARRAQAKIHEDEIAGLKKAAGDVTDSVEADRIAFNGQEFHAEIGSRIRITIATIKNDDVKIDEKVQDPEHEPATDIF